jgi:hypothetical protein
MTATLRQRDRSTWAMTAIRRMIGTLRYVNEELVRAHEAMARPSGAGARERTHRGATADGAKPAA